MMRTAEGTRGHKPHILAEQSRDAMYLRDLDGFFLGHSCRVFASGFHAQQIALCYGDGSANNPVR